MAWLAPALRGPILALCILVAAGDAAAEGAFRSRCEAGQPGLDGGARRPGVSVEAHDSGYRVDNSLSYRALTRIKRPVPAGGTVLGLTRAESRVAISVEGSILDDPETGQECLLPKVGI